MDDGEREAKREKNDEDDGEEMEIEDDEDSNAKPSTSSDLPTYQSHPIFDILALICYERRYPSGDPTSICEVAVYESTTGGHGRCIISPLSTVRHVLFILFSLTRSISVINVIKL